MQVKIEEKVDSLLNKSPTADAMNRIFIKKQTAPSKNISPWDL
jgi:hypothetical protein